MSLLQEFRRVTRSQPCPVCGRQKFCLLDRAEPPARVICTKTESPRRWGEAGFLHVIGDAAVLYQTPRVRRLAVRSEGPRFSHLHERFRNAANDDAVNRLASAIGLSSGALDRLGIGWASADELERAGTTCKDAGCWSFPMLDSDGKVIGIRLRTASGFKYAVAGSHQGFFVPADLSVGHHLLIAEGPTDTAALLDLGFAVVGRPCCNGGVRIAVAIVQRLRARSVVIVADADAPGLQGAVTLGSVLAAYTYDVRVIRPPEPCGDARDWKLSGSPDAVASEVQAAIAAAVPRRLSITQGKAGH